MRDDPSPVVNARLRGSLNVVSVPSLFPCPYVCHIQPLTHQLSRKARGTYRASASLSDGRNGGGPSESQFAANRRPGVSHVMTVRLSVSGETHSLGSDTETAWPNGAITTPGEARAPKNTSRDKAISAGNPETFGDPISAVNGRSGRGYSTGVSGGRDFCIAVAGGLASVLEVFQPLQHVGWAGRVTEPAQAATTVALAEMLHSGGKRREILGMSRVPSAWRRAATAAATAEGQEHIVDNGGDDVVVMCGGGWVGWYHGCHGRFEVRECESSQRWGESSTMGNAKYVALHRRVEELCAGRSSGNKGVVNVHRLQLQKSITPAPIESTAICSATSGIENETASVASHAGLSSHRLMGENDSIPFPTHLPRTERL